MAEQLPRDEMASLQEVAVSNAFEVAALIAILEQKGILTHQEVLDEITRQRKSRPRGK